MLIIIFAEYQLERSIKVIDNNEFFIFIVSLMAVVSVVIGYMIGRLVIGGRLLNASRQRYQKLIDDGFKQLEVVIADQIKSLQKDMQQTSADMSAYVKESLDKILKDEVKQYEMALETTRRIAVDSIKQQQAQITQQNNNINNQYKTTLAEVRQSALDAIKQSQTQIEEQTSELRVKLGKDLEQEKQNKIAKFEENMTDVVSYYVKESIGKQMELREQLPIILADLQAAKSVMIEDIKNGA